MDKFTPEYIQNVQQIIKNDEKDKARELLKDLHPADIAELYQQLNLDEAEYIYMLLDGEKAADVLLELDEDDREKML
ncbi:magnesium transporter MgtE N-terminal domain-containing protein, partial [Barnesiella intestinihominis]